MFKVYLCRHRVSRSDSIRRSSDTPVPDQGFDVETQRRADTAYILVIELLEDRRLACVVETAIRGEGSGQVYVGGISLKITCSAYRNNTLISLDLALFLRMMVRRPSRGGEHVSKKGRYEAAGRVRRGSHPYWHADRSEDRRRGLQESKKV